MKMTTQAATESTSLTVRNPFFSNSAMPVECFRAFFDLGIGSTKGGRSMTRGAVISPWQCGQGAVTPANSTGTASWAWQCPQLNCSESVLGWLWGWLIYLGKLN